MSTSAPEQHDPVEVVRRLGGRARAAEITAWTSRHHLGVAVAQGRLLRLKPGVYVVPALPDAHVAAARAGGAISHASAALEQRLWLVAVPEVVDVTVPRGARPVLQPGVRLHWRRSGVPAAMRVTPVLQTVLDCATTMTFPEALAVADGAVAQRHVTPDDLIAAARASPARGRARRVRVARAADPRADNAFESCLRGIVLEAGLTGFEPQYEIHLPRFTVHADLAHPELRIVIEADSFRYHGTRQALARDCERYDELVAAGWIVLRFAWEHVMFRQEWVASVIRQVYEERRPVRRVGDTAGVGRAPTSLVR